MENDNLSLIFFIATLMGILSAFLAKKRGRHPYGWFFIGFLLGLIGIALLYLLPKIKPQDTDTPQPRERKAPIPPKIIEDKLWYYLDSKHKQHGPVGQSFLVNELRGKRLSEHTYVWNEDLTEWKKVKDLKETFDFL